MQFPVQKILLRLFFTNMRGDGGIPWIVMILVLLTCMATYMVGGVPKIGKVSQDAQQYEIAKNDKAPTSNTSAMQLREIKSKKKAPDKVPDPSKQNNTPDNSNPDQQNTNQSTPTPTTAACSNIAVDFLVDSSGSMLNSSKIDRVKFLLQEYIRTLPENALIAIQTFAEPPQAASDVVPFTKVGPQRDNIITKIDTSINPDPNWATYMREGFKLAQSRLASAKSQNPSYKFYLVLISDGVPELDKCIDSHMPGGKCALGEDARNYDYTQDPTSTRNSGGNLADAIKKTGVTIFSVGIFDDQDQQVNSQLQTLLGNIASGPSNFFKADNSGQLSNIFPQLAGNICK